MSDKGKHSSDDDDDVVVLQVCATKHCQGIDNLVFDEETNENYCGRCRALYARTATEGFRILLGEDDLALVKLIFKRFEQKESGYWTYNEWAEFQKCTGHSSGTTISSPEALQKLFKEEYDIDLSEKAGKGFVVTCTDLENMYGGYQYNHIEALVEDSDALEEAGVLHTGVLEQVETSVMQVCRVAIVVVLDCFVAFICRLRLVY